MNDDNRYWYFAPTNRKLRYGDGRIAKVGTTHKVKGKPVLCKHGLHASKNPIDAVRYGAGPIAFAVSLGGQVLSEHDKSCCTERTYVAGGIDVTEVLMEFACCVAEVTLLLDEVTHPAPWECIEATRAFMRGECSAEILDEKVIAAREYAYAAHDDYSSAAWGCEAAVFAADADAVSAVEAASQIIIYDNPYAEMGELLDAMLTEHIQQQTRVAE